MDTQQATKWSKFWEKVRNVYAAVGLANLLTAMVPGILAVIVAVFTDASPFFKVIAGILTVAAAPWLILGVVNVWSRLFGRGDQLGEESEDEALLRGAMMEVKKLEATSEDLVEQLAARERDFNRRTCTLVMVNSYNRLVLGEDPEKNLSKIKSAVHALWDYHLTEEEKGLMRLEKAREAIKSAENVDALKAPVRHIVQTRDTNFAEFMILGEPPYA